MEAVWRRSPGFNAAYFSCAAATLAFFSARSFCSRYGRAWTRLGVLLSYRSLGAARGLTIYNGGAALIHKQWHFSSEKLVGNQTPPTTANPAQQPLTRSRLHEPFVSPEFTEATDRPGEPHHGSSRLLITDSAPWRVRPEAPPLQQAAPLYTVRAGGGSDRGGGVVLPISANNPDSIALTKRLALSVVGSCSVKSSPNSESRASNRAIAPCFGTAGVLNALGREKQEYRSKPKPAPTRDCTVTRPAIDGDLDNVARSQRQTMAEDLSPFVEKTSCTWGEDIGSVVGQHIFPSAGASDRVKMLKTSRNRSAVVTTGMFPQTIQLRFSCRVNVSSVHLRATSISRIAVHSSDGVLGDKNHCGRMVSVQGTGCISPLDVKCIQDIDVDTKGLESVEGTRSVSVTIVASEAGFSTVYQLYALGVRA